MNESLKREALISNLKIIIDGVDQLLATNREHYMLPIANSIRTICHDSPKSRSILSQLNLMNTDFISPQDAGEGLRNNKTVLAWPMIRIQEIRSADTISFRTIAHGTDPNDKIIPFKKWWIEPVVVQNAQVLTRKDIILQTSNKLGGAHLDIENQSQAFRTFKEQAVLYLGMRSLETDEENENILPLMIYEAHMIQISFELVTSLRKVIPEIDDYLNENY